MPVYDIASPARATGKSMLVQKRPLKPSQRRAQLQNVLGTEADYLGSEGGDDELVRHDNCTGDSYLPALRVFSPMSRPKPVKIASPKKKESFNKSFRSAPSKGIHNKERSQIGKFDSKSLMERHRNILVQA